MEPVQSTINKRLICELSDKELQKHAEELSDKLSALSEAESQRKIENDFYKRKIDDLNDEIRELCKKIRYRAEDRLVEVQVIIDRLNDVYTETRLDTGEVIHERRLSAAERQLEIGEIGIDEKDEQEEGTDPESVEDDGSECAKETNHEGADTGGEEEEMPVDAEIESDEE